MSFVRKYWRTAVMAVLMAGVVASAAAGSGHVGMPEVVLLAAMVVISTSSADDWRFRCRRAENETKKAG